MRYVHLPGAAVDVALLEDATRRGTWDSEMRVRGSKRLIGVMTI